MYLCTERVYNYKLMIILAVQSNEMDYSKTLLVLICSTYM